MAKFDPSENSVEEVLEKLERVGGSERDRILAEERAGKNRKTILEPYGIDPAERVDPTGRTLYPWEVTGDDMADANRVLTESDEARAAREAQLEQDQLVASQQGAGDPPGTGVAPPVDAAPAGGVAGTGPDATF